MSIESDWKRRALQSEEACLELSKGMPLGEIAGKHTIQNMMEEIKRLEAELAQLREVNGKLVEALELAKHGLLQKCNAPVHYELEKAEEALAHAKGLEKGDK